MFEVWKPITGFESLYHVSNYGRVKSIGGRPQRPGGDIILKQAKGKFGHCRVQLCKQGTVFRALVHRLVAAEFISGPHDALVVNHIDFDPTNNHVSNLEWVTQKQNLKHSAHRIPKVKGVEHPASRLTDEMVVEIRQKYAEGDISFAKLSKQYGISAQQCHKIVRRERWSHL